MEKQIVKIDQSVKMDQSHNKNIGSLLGVSSLFSSALFVILILGFEAANIKITKLLNGHFVIVGDTSLLWLAGFLIGATVLLRIQFNLQQNTE